MNFKFPAILHISSPEHICILHRFDFIQQLIAQYTLIVFVNTLHLKLIQIRYAITSKCLPCKKNLI